MIFKEGTVVEGDLNGEKVIGAVVQARELPLDGEKTEINTEESVGRVR